MNKSRSKESLKPYKETECKIPDIRKPENVRSSTGILNDWLYNLERGRTLETSDRHWSRHDFKKKYNNYVLKDDSAETSPVEEVLNYQPATLGKKDNFSYALGSPTEIVNIASLPSYSNPTDSGTHQQWVYEKEPLFYQRPMESDSEDARPLSPQIINTDPDPVLCEDLRFSNNMSRYNDLHQIYEGKAKLVQKHTPRDEELSARYNQPSKEHLNESKTSKRNRTPSQNSNHSAKAKSNDFESKRQEVLKRKEMIEKQRLDKISQKIKEKDEKFK